MIAQIYNSIGSQSFDCSVPHNLTFLIGGKPFPVDPRDFIHQSYTESGDPGCAANLEVTDPPGDGGFLYSWSLGDPFLKSYVSRYHCCVQLLTTRTQCSCSVLLWKPDTSVKRPASYRPAVYRTY